MLSNFLKINVCALLCVVSLASSATYIPQKLTTYQLDDSLNVLTIQDVIDLSFDENFGDVLNLGIKENATWLKIELPPNEGGLFLQIESPMLDSVFFYQVLGKEILSGDTTGVAFPFSTRQIDSPQFLFELMASEEKSLAFLRVQSGKQVIVVPTINDKYELLKEQNASDIFFSFYAGLMMVMFLYNLFVYISVRDQSYLYYIGYILFVGLTQLVLNGYGNQFVWPNNTWIAMRATHFSGVVSGVATIIFAGQFLHVRQNSKWLFRLMIGYSLLYLVALVTSTLGYFQFSFNLINFCAMFSLILIFGSVQIYRKGFKPALYFVIAWLFFLIGVVIFVLKDYGIFPYNNLTRFALPVGSALEVVLLSLALADRINQLKREKEVEQEEKLFALSENERIIKQQNATLESRVNERTRELERANNDLNLTLANLKSAQAQLVDAEKMASLGQMTAGIAHELNNPINFVSGNISPLKRDIDDLFKVIDNLEGIMPEDAEIHEKVRNIQQLSKDLELPFLRTEIGQLLKGIEDGASRTSAIVRGLRVFSRLDEDALKKADVNECLISTLIILKSNMRGEATIIEDLDPNMKDINCFPGKLNQVFMNIINNAMQASAGLGRTKEERKIWITTRFESDNVVVRIKDNGVGIPEAVKQRIFDPFFTTKDVGEGTGLGLSIVLGIVNDHKGTIVVESDEGVGTEFIITLPGSL
ncbi:MAG: GHKL domain-containing protein [Cryomorphaceae bacterium]|nr:GHKL domain-containing protein [Cryomorphaceae bacterium]